MHSLILALFFICLMAANDLHAACQPLSLLGRDLPAATVGSPFSAKIQAYGGSEPLTFMLTEGLLPPGLRLDKSGSISGTPQAKGEYRLTVTAADTCSAGSQLTRQNYLLTVLAPGETIPDSRAKNQTPLSVTVQPLPADSSVRAASPTFKVTYRVKALPPETAILSSPGISYIEEGSVLQSLSLPLEVVLVNGEGEVTEEITIPREVVRSVQRGKGKFIINRPFIGHGTTAAGIVSVSIQP